MHINKEEKEYTKMWFQNKKADKLISDVEYKVMPRNEKDNCAKFWYLKHYQVFNIEMSNNKKKTINFKVNNKVSSDATDMYMNKEENHEKICAIVYTTPHDKAFYDLK